MEKARHTRNQIITKLREGETAWVEGSAMADAIPDIGAAKQIYCRW
jgi:hypothetical protein